MTPQLKAMRMKIRQQMEELVLKAAEEIPNFGFQAEYADNYWTVLVMPNGEVINKNYAYESHGPSRNVASLATWELGRLIQEIETGQFQQRQTALNTYFNNR